jgi:glutamyl-tRNA synthetase
MTPGEPRTGCECEVTRLAPSPTGALHLGNARTFVVNWALARQRGWRVVLRIEDLDTPRVKAGAIEETIETLAWLGLDWDVGPMVQSADLEPYREAMRRLASAGRVYRCVLSRGEIEAAGSAPQEGVHEVRFPPSLRGEVSREFDDGPGTNWRLVVDEEIVEFEDGLRGPTRVDPAAEIGDFVVWMKSGQPSYQLAVVVDDARQSVTQVVRGDDLVGSAGRQMLLQRALGVGVTPRYTHLPLVRGRDGRRLAKRHGDTRLTTYRQTGVSAERVIGLIARWSGVEGGAMSAAEFAGRFVLERMPRQDVVFDEEDRSW